MAGVASDVFDRMVTRGTLKRDDFRIIYKSPIFPTSSFAYAHDLKPELARKIMDCFLSRAVFGDYRNLRASRELRLRRIRHLNGSDLGVFAPPLRPLDLVGRMGGLHDRTLLGGTEFPIKVGQRGLDKPRFEDHPCGLAVGVKLLGHPQRH
jgi:ABC transporter, phosphonate, periplasmic substrate-binding protein